MVTRVHFGRLVAAAVAAATFVCAPDRASAQDLSSWERFDFAHRRVDSTAVEKLPLPALRSLRGIVFGKHGRPFGDEPDVQAYLKTRPWYRANAAYSNARLSPMEKSNI